MAGSGARVDLEQWKVGRRRAGSGTRIGLGQRKVGWGRPVGCPRQEHVLAFPQAAAVLSAVLPGPRRGPLPSPRSESNLQRAGPTASPSDCHTHPALLSTWFE